MARVIEAANPGLPPGEQPLLALVDRWLGGEPAQGEPRLAARRHRLQALARFQQLTSPVAAKSVEDTAFYRFGVLLSRNHGQQLALAAGLAFCRGERVLIIDADLQDPPELLTQMMARMDQGFDVVYGRRRSRAGETRFKTGSAHLFYRVMRGASNVEIAADSGDFRLLSRRVVDILTRMPEEHRFLRGMVSWIGFAQSPFDYDRAPRLAGETKYPLRKMLRLAADALTGFSTLPLRLATYAGFCFAGLGVLTMLYVLGSWFAGLAVQGWASIMATMLIIGSVQLIVVGILGEYIGRLYMQSKARPLFIVDQVLRDEG